jgi:tetratricopeptide (TPR) repeat protein
VAIVVLAIVAVAVGIRLYQRGHVKAGQRASYLFYQGVSMMASGNYPSARQTLQEVRDSFGSSPMARQAALALAQTEVAMGDGSAALTTLDQALGSVSDSEPLWRSLMMLKAATLDDLKRSADSEAIYRQLLARKDLTPHERYDLTLALVGSLKGAQRYKDAADLLTSLQNAINSGELDVPARDLDARIQTLRALAG